MRQVINIYGPSIVQNANFHSLCSHVNMQTYAWNPVYFLFHKYAGLTCYGLKWTIGELLMMKDSNTCIQINFSQELKPICNASFVNEYKIRRLPSGRSWDNFEKNRTLWIRWLTKLTEEDWDWQTWELEYIFLCLSF